MGEKVDQVVMDWVTARRRARRRTQARTKRERQDEEYRKSDRTVRIFVQVDASRAMTIDL